MNNNEKNLDSVSSCYDCSTCAGCSALHDYPQNNTPQNSESCSTLQDNKPKEECGIFGVSGAPNDDIAASELIYFGLYALQHRGQESCGIAVKDNGIITYHKDMGLVADVFSSKTLQELGKGSSGIGHVRYSTTGDSFRENAQPLVTQYMNGPLTIAHNGNISNVAEIKDKLIADGAIFHSTSDTEVVSYLIAKERGKNNSIEETIPKVIEQIEGAYCFLIMTPRKLIAVRDPHGFRPLCMGKIGDSIIFASESCALDAVGAEFIRDVEPGEMIAIVDGKMTSYRLTNQPKQRTNCIFEYIYFARPDSYIDGVSVYKSRIRAGIELANQHPVDADIVIGVPDSGITAAIGYSKRSGIKYGVGLIKNRYIGRTFIAPTQSLRTNGVKIKLNALKETVNGKKVVMVDDSIVRGTTCRRIINLLKKAGAKEVHMRVSAPPFKHPCYFGTDIPSRDDLIANQYTIDEICKLIGADSLGFLSIDSLHNLVKCDSDAPTFCNGCFSGEYPIEVPEDYERVHKDKCLGKEV
ncbi:MAG: amidophosphoribosyltransferase [Clostridiales bacterium]|jgi:amidophosphoribosyltransferase|nr:amidophosphoribosyltransferase [Clostridiales bacterium]